MDAKQMVEEEDARWMRATLYSNRQGYRYNERPARTTFGLVVHWLRKVWRA